MSDLHATYRISEANLEARRAFVDLTEGDVHALAARVRWARKVAPALAAAFYDHQFASRGTAAFFDGYARERGVSLATLRDGLEQAQAQYFIQIFEEADGGGRFGADYFEKRLHVGRVHNAINLPLKWYVGSYATWFTVVRRQLRRDFPTRPALRSRVERALVLVFNLDMQAIVEAFYYDTFASMGVDLEAIVVTDPLQDLSDHGRQLKGAVAEKLDAVARVTGSVRTSSGQVAASSAEIEHAMNEVANAIGDVAQGAGRQAQMIELAVRSVDDVVQTVSSSAENAQLTAAAAEEARSAAADGVSAAEQATLAIDAVRDTSNELESAIGDLNEKSEKISVIVETITEIAAQTNLLALNAAIEAARAGDHGSGFAVVADEVRKLAEDSKRSGEEIAALIQAMQSETTKVAGVVRHGAERTEHGVDTVTQTREAFGRISAAVVEMSARVEQIAAEAHEISGSATSLQDAINEVAAVAEQTSASTEEVSASAQQTTASVHEISTAAHAMARHADDLSQMFAERSA
jgi:methyl-accepting chemotaxis protein